MVDLSRDFWIRETGTCQQVAQLHDMMMTMMMMMNLLHILGLSCGYLHGGDTEVKKLKGDIFIEVREPIQNIK